MTLLAWIVFGAVVGWLASVLMKTNSEQGMLGDIVVGVIGGLVGGLIFNFVGQPGITGFNLYSVIVAVIGASVLIFLVRMARR